MMGELCDETPRWQLSPTEPAWIASRERAHGIVTIRDIPADDKEAAADWAMERLGI
ncbi:hypothetical protein ACFQZZ_07570 [Nocardia sp. GCM10030253]|uniref:hypothetical protein n=1 Tax=Nocardia sp. GCM10030253 TaxID=3273404 RepID=UPI003628D3EB